ncbi:unnamed protein product [Rhizoctonia solani]|uniref:Ubiquitin-like protease family profile domain-containing protein n=1 Tax=Rhizoctonia solani TaxID=456999 RepID=A0A8H3AXQ9_9AGAM|nr:unnamed protein product [Rhizoctonia solani]
MATRGERQDITALHRASNGQGNSAHDSRKKRPREDDASSGGGVRRRAGGFENPYGGIGRSNLQERRTNGGRTLKRDSSPSVTSTDSRSNTSKAPIGYAAFGPRSGVLDSYGPPASAMHSGQSLPHHPSSIRQPSSTISKEINDKMDGAGEGEGTLSLAAVLGDAGIPETPERGDHGLKEPSSHGRSRSSPDPLNIIKVMDNAPHPVNSTPKSVKSAVQPINVDEDEITDVDPPRPWLGSPKGTSVIKKGKVKQTTLMFEPQTPNSTLTTTPTSAPARTSPTLEKFLAPKSTKASGASTSTAGRKLTRSTPIGPIANGGSTSKGLPIPIGVTRPKVSEGKISARMHGKSQQGKSQQGKSQGKSKSSGLKIFDRGGSPAPSQKPLSRSKVRDSKPRDLILHIQEWYCDPKHYESNTSQGLYSLKFDGNKITITKYDRPGVETSNLCLMGSEVDGFEVVDTAEDESYLWMLVKLNERTLSKLHWQRNGLGDSNRVLLHFLESDDPESDDLDVHERWKALIQGMAKWTQKGTVKKSAMDSLVKITTDRSSFNLPKVQDIDAPTLQHEPNTDVTTRAPPPSKPRTRSAISNSSQAPLEKESKPIIVPDADEVVLVHPTGAGSVTINRGELARLEPGEFLNDTLIELGLKMWLNDLRLKDPALVDQIHIFSSFFFKKLDAGRGKGCDYNSVKKWTSKFDLFSKRFIIIPINEHLHWYLAIICFPEHVLEAPFPQPLGQPARVTRSSDAAVSNEQRMSSESDMQVDQTSLIDTEVGSPIVPGKAEDDKDLADKSERMAIDSTTPPESQPDVVDVDPKPSDTTIVDITNDNEDTNSSQDPSVIKSDKTWILILDSLGGRHPRTVRILRQYLQAEAQERRGKVVDIKDSRSSGGLVEDKHLSAPVQPNWCDCGVYLLHYVEVFYANPLEIIGLPPGAKRKGKEAANRYDELWRTDKVKDKRTVFREKLHELSAKWMESKSSPSKNSASILGILPSTIVTDSKPHLQADASVMEIEPPEIGDVPPATTEPPTMPLELRYPPLEVISPSTTMQEAAEVEGLVYSDIQPEASSTVDGSPINVSSNSSQLSSRSKATRRGKKGGSDHGSKHGSRSSVDHKVDTVSENIESPVNLGTEREISVDL